MAFAWTVVAYLGRRLGLTSMYGVIIPSRRKNSPREVA